MRRDHGWAALQHQCLLRTSVVVADRGEGDRLAALRVELTQGAEFAFVPHAQDQDEDRGGASAVTWYQGDVYDFASTPSGTRGQGRMSNFARSITLRPGKYTVIVRAMYEIRMFGDPGLGKLPSIDTCFRIELDDATQPAEIIEGLRVVPDIIDGWLMGDWISVPIRLPADTRGYVTVTGVKGEIDGSDIGLALATQTRVAPGQTRPVALRIKQDGPIESHLTTLHVVFTLEHDGRESTLEWKHDLVHRDSAAKQPFLMTFASPDEPKAEANAEPALVSYASVVPPSLPLQPDRALPPVLLALHGAGVDVETPFWAAALPAVPGMWSVLPTGKNEWGEDWHGGSMEDVWAARRALSQLAPRLGVSISDQTL